MSQLDTLSIAQARKLVLHSQQLPPKQAARGSAKSHIKGRTLAAIEQLNYIQIDTISVVQRAHHHTLWNRNPDYQPEQLEQLLLEKKVFEYWSHAAAYLPMRDYRFSLFRKQALASGRQDHWYPRNEKLMREVLSRIQAEGPLMAKDFAHTGKKTTDWHSKPAKQALEYLFMQGDLMVPYRRKFHKVYDLRERVLADEVDCSVPSDEEYARFLIRRYLQANGLGQAAQMAYLLKNIKPAVTAMLSQMQADGELLKVRVGSSRNNDEYYALPDSLALLNKPLARNKLKILSPFDNLLIQRQRMQALFDFDYKIECYVPAAKRQYGYFALPLLWQGQLVGRMDCKAERQKGAKQGGGSDAVLQIYNLVLEAPVKDKAAFMQAFCKALQAFMRFNATQTVALHKASDADLKPLFKAMFKFFELEARS